MRLDEVKQITQIEPLFDERFFELVEPRVSIGPDKHLRIPM
jgi:hypothetical protein